MRVQIKMLGLINIADVQKFYKNLDVSAKDIKTLIEWVIVLRCQQQTYCATIPADTPSDNSASRTKVLTT